MLIFFLYGTFFLATLVDAAPTVVDCSTTGKSFEAFRALKLYLDENTIHNVDIPPLYSFEQQSVYPYIQFSVSSLHKIDEVKIRFQVLIFSP